MEEKEWGGRKEGKKRERECVVSLDLREAAADQKVVLPPGRESPRMIAFPTLSIGCKTPYIDWPAYQLSRFSICIRIQALSPPRAEFSPRP